MNTETSEGKARLRKIAKECVNYGQRVQNSVFECMLDSSQYRALQSKLYKLINSETDSIRFYNLGKNYENKIEHYGIKCSYMPEDPMII